MRNTLWYIIWKHLIIINYCAHFTKVNSCILNSTEFDSLRSVLRCRCNLFWYGFILFCCLRFNVFISMFVAHTWWANGSCCCFYLKAYRRDAAVRGPRGARGGWFKCFAVQIFLQFFIYDLRDIFLRFGLWASPRRGAERAKKSCKNSCKMPLCPRLHFAADHMPGQFHTM